MLVMILNTKAFWPLDRVQYVIPMFEAGSTCTLITSCTHFYWLRSLHLNSIGYVQKPQSIITVDQLDTVDL